MMKAFFVIYFFASVGLAAVKVEPIDPSYDEYEGFELAGVLLENGQHEKAYSVLSGVSEKEKKSAIFFQLTADYFFQIGQFEKARENYLNALSSERSDPRDKTLIWPKLAETYFNLKKHQLCAEAFRHSQVMVDRHAVMHSRCEFQMGNWRESWQVLQGKVSIGVVREKITLLLKIHLDREAETRAFESMGREDLSSTDGLGVVDIFLENKRMNSAFRLLEVMRWKFPGNSEVLLAWAQLAYQRGLTLQTAEAFSLAAVGQPKYFYAATELFRQLGRGARSAFLSQFIQDDTERLKAQVAMAVDKSRYVDIATLEGPISRTHLYKDDEVNYALAYSMMKRSDFGSSVKYLDRIQKPEMLTRVLALRKVIDDHDKVLKGDVR